jgi:carboxyl-terminal processing protease
VQRGGEVILNDGAAVYERPLDSSRVVARVAGGTLPLPAQAATSGFVRVDVGGGRPGWVSGRALSDRATGARGKLVDVLAHMPPRLDVDYGGALTTNSDTLKIQGSAVDDARVRDVYIFVGSRKVYYQSNRAAADPKREAFAATLPLRPGINFVMVVARESNDVASRKSFIVRRDAPDGTLLETPKTDEDEADLLHEVAED